MTWFLYCVPNWLLLRPYDLIFALCSQVIPFMTIWPNFITVYPIDSFQDHMTWSSVFHMKDLYVVRAQKLIFLQSGICCEFQAWNLVDFIIFSRFHEIWQISHKIWWISCLKAINQITQAKNFTSQRGQGAYVIWTLWNPPDFTWNLLDFMTWNLLDFMQSARFQVKSSRLHIKDHFARDGKAYVLYFCISTQITPFKTIWPNFCIVYPFDSFQDHMTWFLYCVPKLLLSRPYDLILSLYTQLMPFRTIWPDFCIVYPNYSFQDHLT